MALVPVKEVQPNYTEDSDMLNKANQTINLYYSEGEISITVSDSKGEDHFFTITVDEDDFMHALEKAKKAENVSDDNGDSDDVSNP